MGEDNYSHFLEMHVLLSVYFDRTPLWGYPISAVYVRVAIEKLRPNFFYQAGCIL